MEIIKLTKDKLNEIMSLYDYIKEKTYNLWDNGYPSVECINYDIERDGLWGVMENDKLIAVCYAGERCEDDEENYTWKDSFKRRGTFARIGVSPDYQNQGVATFLLKFILEELKKQGFDGVRILVGASNKNAIKLYEKFGFVNCGVINKMGHEYFLFELRLF